MAIKSFVSDKSIARTSSVKDNGNVIDENLSCFNAIKSFVCAARARAYSIYDLASFVSNHVSERSRFHHYNPADCLMRETQLTEAVPRRARV